MVDNHERPTAFNGMMVVQGPNYALAKTMQLWRSVVARSAGCLVSCNFAPGVRTESMTSHSTMRAALDGLQHFEPNVVLEPSTASSFMCNLLISDLLAGPDNPTNPACPLEHPFDLFTHNAFHGGGWTCAYDMHSARAAIFLLGSLNAKRGTAGMAGAAVNYG